MHKVVDFMLELLGGMWSVVGCPTWLAFYCHKIQTHDRCVPIARNQTHVMIDTSPLPKAMTARSATIDNVQLSDPQWEMREIERIYDEREEQEREIESSNFNFFEQK